MAGPYVNVESNSFFEGFKSHDSSLLETHIGYSQDVTDRVAWYVQGGPALTLSTETDPSYELSGKVGISGNVSDDVVLYGEINAVTTGDIDFSEDIALGVKAGLTWAF